MKRILLLLAAAALFLGAAKNPRVAYIEQYYPLAVLEMQRTVFLCRPEKAGLKWRYIRAEICLCSSPPRSES